MNPRLTLLPSQVKKGMRKNRAVIFQDLLCRTGPEKESWGKQPNSLNTRSKKAINLEAK